MFCDLDCCVSENFSVRLVLSLFFSLELHIEGMETYTGR
jgi:hypothetical protein